MSSLVDTMSSLYNLRSVAVATPRIVVKRNTAESVKLPVVQGNAPSFSLVSVLDRYLFKIKEAEVRKIDLRIGGPRPQGRFHPSEICKPDVCLRALAYELYSAPRVSSVDARLRRIFDNGHFVHGRLQHALGAALRAEGGVFYDEISFKVGRLSGTTDGGMVLNKWPYLLEIKSMNKARFKELGAKPWDEHFAQLNIYMHCLKVHAGFILVECKDNQDLREYFVRYDPGVFARAEANMDLIEGYVAEGGLPPTISEAEGCSSRCGFYLLCKGARRGTWAPAGPLT